MYIKLIITCVIAAIFGCSLELSAQEKRGNTDYTNNRKKGKSAKDANVNTEQSTPEKIIHFIPGTWEVEAVFRGKEDITDSDTLAKNQTLEFTREGRYMINSGKERIDSGAFRVNEQDKILYLASDFNETTTEWKISFDKTAAMTLQLKDGVVHGERFRYVYRRIPHTTSSKR